ncbi:MAG: thiamine ABC transporter substrate-binding protein [Candidatus Bipolaricaulota bacterium]|nr:thiamine ABC transporter substrate-binding protein [Candidatus Bipolaricaulota bacterium]MDW8127005.1 thiamine ABC transporter substrate-binding protein [Candidatus Bipolaricaulota bacterium]
MRKFLGVLLAMVAVCGWAKELVVYTYDSFVSWGPALAIKERFEAMFPGVQLVWVAVGDSSEMLSRLIAELRLGETRADVFLGVGDMEFPRALAHGVFQPYDPEKIPNLMDVPAALIFDQTGRVLPYDHGYVTFVYDSELLPGELVPKTLDDLLRPELKGKIVIEDPRTSSPGLAFFLWTIARYGEGWLDYWRKLIPNLLTITKGWSEAYDIFLAGEAPIVLSYSTDTAYSYIEHGSLRYQVITPNGEAYRQIEGMGIVSGTDEPELAHAFLNLVLSVEIQELIPTTQWMFPANARAKLPAGYEYAVIPERPVFIDPQLVQEKLEEWLSLWQSLLIGR